MCCACAWANFCCCCSRICIFIPFIPGPLENNCWDWRGALLGKPLDGCGVEDIGFRIGIGVLTRTVGPVSASDPVTRAELFEGDRWLMPFDGGLSGGVLTAPTLPPTGLC